MIRFAALSFSLHSPEAWALSVEANEARWRSIKSQWPRWIVGCRATAKEFEQYAPEIHFIRLGLNRGMVWAFRDTIDRAVFKEFQREWKRKMKEAAREPSERPLCYHGARGTSPSVDSLLD